MSPNAIGGARNALAQRVDRPRISDLAYEDVLRAILDHRFQPGQRLSIRDLAKRLGISQMPVRTAIDRLAEEGLVDIRPRSGSYVRQVDERDVAETFDIRRALDQLAAETAVHHTTDEDIAELEDLVVQMDDFDALGANGMKRHDRLNWQFHLLIVGLSGNEKLYQMYKQLNAHLTIASVHVSNRDWAKRVPQAQREHRAMIQALRARSAEDLSRVLAEHAKRSKLALVGDIRRRR